MVMNRFVVMCALLGALFVGSTSTVLGDEKSLEIGVLPNVSARQLMIQYEPMQQFLSKALGRKAAFSSAPDWPTFYQRVKQGDYQVVVAASNVARLIEKDLGYRPILAYQPRIPALFVTAAGPTPPLGELLKGTGVGLANPASLVAFEGLRWLEGQNLRGFKIFRVRGEDSVGNAILRGDAAAGIMSMGEFRSHPAEIRERLKIHTQIKDVPSFIILVAPGLPVAQANQLRAELLIFASQSDEGRQFFERSGFKAIVPVDESELVSLDVFVEATRNALK